MNKETTELFESMKSLSEKSDAQNGYIFLPYVEGFKVFKISKKRLENYLTLESMYRENEKK